MNKILGLIMFLCFVPFLIIMYFVMYPKNWKKKKTIFGVRNRSEFLDGDNSGLVDEIVKGNRKLATVILISSCIISLAFLLIPNLSAMMISFTVFIMIICVVIMLPHIKGNGEMKSLKRELGIVAGSTVRTADLKSISASHTFNILSFIIPNGISMICLVFSILYDLKLVDVGKGLYQGSFGATVLSGVFFFQGVLFVVLAIMMDNMRNEVISQKSDVNANYNRAKKKLWSDMWLLMTWLNTALLLFMVFTIVLGLSPVTVLVGATVWLVATILLMFMLTRKTSLLNEHYESEKVTEDDDDFWIYGVFYYNPKDARLNVEKRTGLGSTVNMAHPVGKVIAAFCVLAIVFSFVMMFYVGVIEVTPLELRVDNGYVICHQLRDEYNIALEDIKEVTYVENKGDFKPIKIAGVESDNVLKGKFGVEGENDAKLFMNGKVDSYIRIKTDKTTYFINDKTEEETKLTYEEIKK